MTGYLLLINRGRRKPMLAPLAAFTIITAAGLSWWGGQTAVTAAVEWCQHHVLMLSAVSLILTAILLARRRTIKKAQAARSWLAALPSRPLAGRAEAFVIVIAPAFMAIVAIAALYAFVTLRLHVGPKSSLPAPTSLWLSITLGVCLGAILSYLLPASKPITLPPGSRYVPHRRPLHSAVPHPSLRALGYWPIRRMFSRLQPRVVARASMPVLLSMGLGTTADVAMLAIGIAALVGLLLLLVLSVISVSDEAARWLRPLPIRPAVIARRILVPSVTVMAAAGVSTTGLLVAAETPVVLSTKIGTFLFLACSLVAVFGTLTALARGRRPS